MNVVGSPRGDSRTVKMVRTTFPAEMEERRRTEGTYQCNDGEWRPLEVFLRETHEAFFSYLSLRDA